MYNLKWAKGELATNFPIDFLFTFKCRELNGILNKVNSLEELFKKCYPEEFQLITLDDLKLLGHKVMIIIDGVDELQDIYTLENKVSSEFHHVQIVQQLIDQTFIPDHKTIVCGKPKACQFLQNSLMRDTKNQNCRSVRF